MGCVGDDPVEPARQTLMSARVVASVTVIALGGFGLVPSIAAANHAPVADGNDVRGLLDIKEVTIQGGQRKRAKVITHKRWTADRMRDRGYVLVYLDTFADERPDYYVLIRSTGSEMKAELYRDRKTKNDYIVGSTDAWKAEKNSVSVRLPLRKTHWGKTRTFYRWNVLSLFSGRRCKRVCLDRAPQGTTVEEPRPGVPPEATAARTS
jgi:hypothetical protein